MAILFYQQKKEFEAFVAYFTTLTSFMYHLCDSVQQSVWMTAGKWHRLDNIGAITAFACWFIYLCRFKERRMQQRIYFFFFAVVLVAQEKSPWDERYTYAPIGAACALLLVRFVFFHRHMEHVRYVGRTTVIAVDIITNCKNIRAYACTFIGYKREHFPMQ